MTQLVLSGEHTGSTSVSNIFIDAYMPAANGNYVKVYLYLLRCLTGAQIPVSVSSIADVMENTENDILRALAYWEKKELLTITRDEQGQVTALHMETPLEESSVSNSNSSTDFSISAQSAALPSSSEKISVPISTAKPADASPPMTYTKPTYTRAQIDALTKDDEIKWILDVVERYMERLLKPTDLQLILFLYESLGFSADLIFYLFEYCISKNKKSPAYIESVAIAWSKEGIDSREKAEASAVIYNTNYNAVSKAFGLNRSLGNIEQTYINKWVNEWNFELSLITEACNRTLLSTGQPDFKYTDRILENWHNQHVTSAIDIKHLDEQHQHAAKKVPDAVHTFSNKPAKQVNNRFTAYPQRNYSEEDYSSIEQRLLNRS